ncbi:MAG: MFS transporter [Cyanobacteria bacterium P01_G01_bin.54]
MPRLDTDDWPANDADAGATQDVSPETEPAPTPSGFGPVLRNRRFLLLWVGQLGSQLADKVYLVMMIALITQVFQVGEETISNWVSAIMIAFTIPAVLFGSLAGVYVDRWLKKDILVGTNLVRGGFVFLIPLLLWLNQDVGALKLGSWGSVPSGFVALLLVTFFVSTLTQFFAPAEQATIPLLVPRDHLLPANSLYTTTMLALVILGFAAGEPLLAACDRALLALNPAWNFGQELLVGGGYLIAGLILLGLQTGEQGQPKSETPSQVWQDIWDGLRYLRQQPRVRNALIQLIILFCIFAALAVLAVPLAAQLPGLKPEQFGVLLAAGGMGMGLGAVAVGNWGQRLPSRFLVRLGLVGMAGCLVGLSTVTEQPIGAIATIALLGCFAAGVGIPMQTLIQSETPESMRGKVFGLQNNAVNIALSLPLALAGLAASRWGLPAVLFGLAVVVLVGGLGSSLLTQPAMVTSTNVKKR